MPEKKSKAPAPFVPSPELLARNEELKRRQVEESAKMAVAIPGKIDTKGFQSLLEKINRQGEQARAHWIPLLRKKPQVIECEEHPDEKRKLNIENSLPLCHRNDEVTAEYDDCPICAQERLVNEKCKKWILMGAPKKTAHATFDNFITGSDPAKCNALKKVRKQVEKGRGFLILFGKYGNGKTHLATAAFKKLGGGIFVTFGQLIDELRGTYEDGGKENLVRKYQNAPVLIVDEVELLGKGREGDIQSADIQPFLYRIFSHRFDRGKFSGLTSNEDLTTILAILGPRLEDRIAQSYVSVSFQWESYRRQHRDM